MSNKEERRHLIVTTLIEDYHQRFEETQNNIKIRNTLLGVSSGAFAFLLQYGVYINKPLIIFLSPFFLFFGIYLHLHLLKANIKIAKHMIQIEEKINKLLCPNHFWKDLSNDEKTLHWMNNHSIIGVENGEDEISFAKRSLNLGILRFLWLLTLIMAIAAIVTAMFLSWSLKDICLANLLLNLMKCFRWWHIFALAIYGLFIYRLYWKHLDIIKYGKGKETTIQEDIAKAISDLNHLIAGASEELLNPEKKAECIDLLKGIAQEAAKPQSNKNVLKALGNSLSEIITTIEPLAEAERSALEVIKLLWS